MQLKKIPAALPTADSPVWSLGSILSIVVAVLLAAIPTVVGDPVAYGVPTRLVPYLQLFVLILGILSAKMSESWGMRRIWTDAQRQAQGEQP